MTKPKERRVVRNPPLGGSAARSLLRVLAGLTVGLGITEGVFWYRDGGAFPHLNVYMEDADRGVRLRPGATERVRFSQNPITRVSINPEGYRGDAWPAPASMADEVVVVGDSQVFGLGVEQGETFSAVMQASLGGKSVVLNLGVPTYGPREYTAVLEEALAKRPSKTVVYVVNLANDLFEATRPNRERHAVWDGWAVRKETAPASVQGFPGRAFLFTSSHAFYALRRYLYDRGPKVDEGGFASEGTWRDIGDAAEGAAKEHTVADAETSRLGRLRESELKYAADGVTVLQQAVDGQVIRTEREHLYDDHPDYENPKWMPNEEIYRASRLSPGDILTMSLGENARDVRVNAEQIRRGAALRVKIEAEARRHADEKKDKEMLGLFARRDESEKKAAALRAEAFPKVVALSPLAPELRAAKAVCDKYGARLLVVALPIDVQVSPAEWTKYGTKPIDMSGTKVLLEDVVVAARVVGAEGLDATPSLAAAEPGAFLDGDIHMTPKGHRALGEAIAGLLKSPPLKYPADGLPASRSWPPRPSEWGPSTEINVRESDPAGCETKRVREWLGIFCRTNVGAQGIAKGVKVTAGDEVIAGVLPGATVLVAPLIRGKDIRATFAYDGTTRELTVQVPTGPEDAVIAFSKSVAAAPVVASGPSPETEAFCACHSSESGLQPCSNATTVPDADCARTYRVALTPDGGSGKDCLKMLACAMGDPSSSPKCAAGQVNAGAALRCHALCSPSVPCAKGHCVEWQGGQVCM